MVRVLRQRVVRAAVTWRAKLSRMACLPARCCSSECVASASNVTHPLLQKREQVKNSLLLVLTSNRGLCGGYNSAILRVANERIRELRAEYNAERYKK